MTELRVALTTSLNDRLVGPLKRTLDEVEKNLKQIEKEFGQITQASDKTNRTMTGMQGPAQAARQVVELAKQTQHAVGLADKLRSAWSMTGNTIKGVTTAVAAFQAAKYVISGPLEKARSYEKQLADAANIAYSGQSTEARRAGMVDMNASVEGAVRTGGGNRESALKGLNDLFAANIDKGDVSYLLPYLQQYATAGNADPSNIANLVIYGLRSLKLKKEEIPLMLDKTLASTNVGSLEFDSLAKWMPQIGAAGSAAGLTGMKGYEQMLAGAQVSRLTAGTKDEAGTNFKDFLSLINGHALMTAAKRMGIDAAGSIAKHIGSGGNALSGAVALADYVADKDPRFAALQKKLNLSQTKRDAKGQPIYTPEQEDIMRQQATLFAGSALGKLFHNQQSMQALVALRNNRDYFKENLAATGEATGQIGAGNMALYRTTNAFKQEQLDNEKLFAQTRAVGSANDALGKLAESATDLYRKYPDYATAVQAASLAIGGLAAAAAGAGGVLGLFALVGKVGKVAAVAETAALVLPTLPGPGAVAAGAGLAGGALLGGALLGGAGLLAGGAVLGAGVLMSDAMNTDAGLRSRIGSRQARLNELTQLAALEGGSGGSAAAKERLDGEIAAMRADRDSLLVKLVSMDEVVREMRALQNRPVQLTVDGQVLAQSMNSTTARTARRH